MEEMMRSGLSKRHLTRAGSRIPVWLTEAAVMPQDSKLYHLEVTMWNKPEYTEMRFGFEVTMYIANR